MPKLKKRVKPKIPKIFDVKEAAEDARRALSKEAQMARAQEKYKERLRKELEERRLRAGFAVEAKWRERRLNLVEIKSRAEEIGMQLRAKYAFFPPSAEEALKREIEAYKKAVQIERDPMKKRKLQRSLELLEAIAKLAFKEFEAVYTGKKKAA